MINQNIMKNSDNMEVGMTFDVITITAERPTYYQLYQKGSTGVVTDFFHSGNASAIIGSTPKDGYSTWLVPDGEYKRIGRLTIKSIK